MTDPSIRLNTGPTLLWMVDKASYLSLSEDWGCLSTKSMDNTSPFTYAWQHWQLGITLTLPVKASS